jgi:hypothetical protein
MDGSQPVKSLKGIDSLLGRRSGDDKRKVQDLKFFEQGGIERRSGVESRQKSDQTVRSNNGNQGLTQCFETKSPVQ